MRRSTVAGVAFVFMFIVAGAASAQNCRPNANQIAIFADWRYQGQCKVLDIAGYATPQAFGFDNDSISSILVGKNVQVEVCQHDMYQGTCETLTGDNDFLENTSVGNDSVSSIRITRKALSGGSGGSGGPKDLRTRLAGSWVAGPDKLVFSRDKFELFTNGKLNFSAAYTVVDENTIAYPGDGGAERRRVYTFKNNGRVLTSTNPATNQSFDYKRSGATTKAVTKKKR